MTANIIDDWDINHFPLDRYIVSKKLNRNLELARKGEKSVNRIQVYYRFDRFKRMENGLKCLIQLYCAPLALLDITFRVYFDNKEDI